MKYAIPLALAAVVLAVGPLALRQGAAGMSKAKGPTRRLEPRGEQGMKEATFAAGCFWGVEEAFRATDGVVDTSVGYTGGHTESPTYRDVCSGDTGHAEAVRVVYDPDKVTYDDLLEVFWKKHDPTQKNRQGPDVGSQYRSAVFYHDETQKAAAEASKRRLDESGRYRAPVVTEIAPAGVFWEAEDYHQEYLRKRGAGSCGF